ncbi:OLC1v1020524C1 [Oldenlandia corymbosa var. corymbosa]|uniref:OLC1v1020524C1 n=1 Tax=Oldenlandia corymbosa var. corymbosa TaxID=529605 RepID=A0AAV1EGK4_OLDCO|nr:OLC1v1020524C1 [Oldenlandia corymbosa var. corymbosa]
MGRTKLEISQISKESTRYKIFKNRKDSLFKKLLEITTLCDLDACMILYPLRGGKCSETIHREIWPDNLTKVSKLINDYGAHYSANINVSASLSFTLTDFYRLRKDKIQKEIKKHLNKEMEMLYPTSIGSMTNTDDQWRELPSKLDSRLNNVKRKMDSIEGSQNKFGIKDGYQLFRQQPQQQMVTYENCNSHANNTITTTRSSMPPPTTLGQNNTIDQWPVNVSPFLEKKSDYNLVPPALLYQDNQNRNASMGKPQIACPKNDHYYSGYSNGTSLSSSNYHGQYVPLKQEIIPYANYYGSSSDVSQIQNNVNYGSYGYPRFPGLAGSSYQQHPIVADDGRCSCSTCSRFAFFGGRGI